MEANDQQVYLLACQTVELHGNPAFEDILDGLRDVAEGMKRDILGLPAATPDSTIRVAFAEWQAFERVIQRFDVSFENAKRTKTMVERGEN